MIGGFLKTNLFMYFLQSSLEIYQPHHYMSCVTSLLDDGYWIGLWRWLLISNNKCEWAKVLAPCMVVMQRQGHENGAKRNSLHPGSLSSFSLPSVLSESCLGFHAIKLYPLKLYV